MNQNLLCKGLIRSAIGLLIAVLTGITALAQPSYTFTGAALVSGTDLQVGAVYRFTNVKPGVDALVTITTITANATVSKIDNDAGAGYVEAFQPEVLVPAYSTGYAQFHLEFVSPGTTTPLVMTDIPATAIDVDGNNGLYGGPLNEFDGISMGPSSFADYDFLGDLTVSFSPGWVQAVNTRGIEYNGITISTPAVNLTVVNASASSFDYRTGVNNNSGINGLSRQKSLYFMRMTYPNSVLAQKSVVSFTGARENNTTKLNWMLTNTGQLQEVVLEKSYDGKKFTPVKSFTGAALAVTIFEYEDNSSSFADQLYYRLSIVRLSGIEYSKLLLFNSSALHNALFNIAPTPIKNTATVTVAATQKGAAKLCLFTSGGQPAGTWLIPVAKGINSFLLQPPPHLSPGVYVATIYVDGKTASKKIMIAP